MENRQEQKFQMMTTLPVEGLICKLALPCIVSMLVTAFYNMADTFFVARALGPDGLAALNLAIPVYSLIHGCGLMLGMGGSTRCAISWSVVM